MFLDQPNVRVEFELFAVNLASFLHDEVRRRHCLKVSVLTVLFLSGLGVPAELRLSPGCGVSPFEQISMSEPFGGSSGEG